MERLLVLRLEAVGCSAEALLNGVPLARVDAARPARTLPVHEFTLAGANQLELVVQPALPGAPEVIAPQLSDGKAWAGVRLLLPRVGQVAHPSNARTLAQIDWAAPDGEVYEAPLHLAQTVDLKIAFPRWRWLDVPVGDDVAAARPQAAQLLQRLAVSLARGDAENLVAHQLSRDPCRRHENNRGAAAAGTKTVRRRQGIAVNDRDLVERNAGLTGNDLRNRGLVALPLLAHAGKNRCRSRRVDAQTA